MVSFEGEAQERLIPLLYSVRNDPPGRARTFNRIPVRAHKQKQQLSDSPHLLQAGEEVLEWEGTNQAVALR